MTKRFENIEYCKAAALLLVLLYHYWVLSGSPEIHIPGLRMLIFLGGEFGVTMFFVLSGFGIYCLLKNKEEISWIPFIKSRLKKIAPLYYFSIILIIAITPEGGSYLSKNGLLHIIMHLLFMHNLLGRFSGTINGALWTMGIIFQYYLIALFLYRCMKKSRNITVLSSILLTIVLKMIVYKYVLPAFGLAGTQYFIYGRQLPTALDNFVLGMYAAAVVCDSKKALSTLKGVFYIAVAIGGIILWGSIGFRKGVYVANILGYIWHSFLAIFLAIIVIIAGKLEENKKKGILHIIGKNEYGIYLLHFPILQNLLQTPIIQQLNSKGLYMLGCLIFLGISLGIGYIFNKKVHFY